MKKIILLLIVSVLTLAPAFSKTDKTSADYLKNKKHFAIMNPIAESIAQKVIKKSLKKDIGKGKYKVKFEGYTLSSMKQGIFKYLEITGNDLIVEEIPVPYMNLKTLTDYNWVDINQNPAKIKSDMTFAYQLNLSEDSINTALKDEKYKKQLQKVNKIAYPLFAVNDTRMKIKNNRIHIIMDYSIPLATVKNKTFMVSTNFKVENGKIRATNVGFDSAYGNLPLNKVINLINLLDPLSFTLDIMKDEKCNGKIENLKIEDNIIKIDGKIFVEKEG